MFLLGHTCYSYMVIIRACTCKNGPRPIPTPHIQDWGSDPSHTDHHQIHKKS